MKYCQFLKSALAKESPVASCDSIRQWLAERNNHVKVAVEKIKFSELDQWHLDESRGTLRHGSGKFFSIEGVDISTNWGPVHNWQQPIINQPEIGFLGIIAKEIKGVLHFLMQAKIEPGNVNNVQISPTLQATKSNYSRVHGGRQPLYLDCFRERNKYPILVDQLQSEQGARFLKKRNRNIIIKVDEELPLHDDFAWLTLGQLKVLTGESNLVNMDTRTVLSGIPFGNYNARTADFLDSFLPSPVSAFARGMLESSLDNESGLHTIDELIAWFTQLKSEYDLGITSIPLQKMRDWVIDDSTIRRTDNKYFKVIATRVEISNREVRSWTQPLIEPAQEGLVAFIAKRIHGRYHFLVQAKLECGNFDILELAPTVQCLTGNYHETRKGTLPYLEYVLNAGKEQVRYDAYQSEEGGRFFREQNRHLIIEAEDDFPVEVPDNYTWMTLNQLSYFLKFNNYLNIQARSLISTILFE